MVIVQIGTNDGCDDVCAFVKANAETITTCVLIEPLEFLNEQIKQNYANINNVIIENIGIAADNTAAVEREFFYEENSDNYQVSSLIENHAKISIKSSNRIVKKLIKVMNINDLFAKYNLTVIDYLFVDAEGVDVDIIDSINFSQFTIKNILFESAHSDGNWNKSNKYDMLVKKLKTLKYDVSDIDALNTQATLKYE